MGNDQHLALKIPAALERERSHAGGRFILGVRCPLPLV
jgi:hypothetical protein